MTDLSKYKPFTGDGRSVPRDILEKYLFPKGSHPIMTNQARCREYLDALFSLGMTQHSARGGMLWIGAAWARANDKPYSVEAHYLDGMLSGYTFRVGSLVPEAQLPKPNQFECRKCGAIHGIPATVMIGEREYVHECECGARVSIIKGTVRPMASIKPRRPRVNQPRNPK